MSQPPAGSGPDLGPQDPDSGPVSASRPPERSGPDGSPLGPPPGPYTATPPEAAQPAPTPYGVTPYGRVPAAPAGQPGYGQAPPPGTQDAYGQAPRPGNPGAYGVAPGTAQQPYGYAPTGPGGATLAAPKKRRGPLVATLVVVLVLLLGGGTTAFLVHQANEARKEREAEALAVAEETYTQSSDALDEALTAFAAAQTDLSTSQTDATTAIGSADTLLTSAVDGYVSADAKSALDTSRTSLQTVIDGWAPSDVPLPTAADPLPAPGEDVPAATEAALDKAADIDADTAAVTDLTTAYDTQATALSDGTTAVDAAGTALLATVPTTSQSFLDTNPIATNATKVDMRLAAVNLSPTWTSSSSTQLSTFVTAAQAVVASQAERTDLLAHPVNPNRAAVEEFSLSLAGGVPIDFTWSQVVNGFGTDGTSGGTSTWTDDNYAYSYSEMNLSNNIAQQWPDFSMKALVAHETGHSITGKTECNAMMQAAPFNGDYETFATAWAIGQGFDDHNGSGEWLYGRPTDEQIAVATGCR